jgi:hypothetical protein
MTKRLADGIVTHVSFLIIFGGFSPPKSILTPTIRGAASIRVLLPASLHAAGQTSLEIPYFNPADYAENATER